MDTGCRPLCGCFVLSCMVGGIFRKPLGFRRCLPPARPEKAKPFQAGQGPCTKRPQTVRLRLYAPKKFLRDPRGVFSKTLLGRGWDSVPQRESKPAIGARLFRQVEVLSRNTHKIVRLRLHAPRKGFEDSKVRFSKTHLCREWDRVPRGRGGESISQKPKGMAGT